MCYADTWIHCNALLLLVSIYVLGHTMPLPFASNQTHQAPPLDSSLNSNSISSVAPLQKYPTPSVLSLCKWKISNIAHIFQVCGTQDVKSKDLWLYHSLTAHFFCPQLCPRLTWEAVYFLSAILIQASFCPILGQWWLHLDPSWHCPPLWGDFRQSHLRMDSDKKAASAVAGVVLRALGGK